MRIFIPGVYGPERGSEPCECVPEKSGQAAYGTGGGDPWGRRKKEMTACRHRRRKKDGSDKF